MLNSGAISPVPMLTISYGEISWNLIEVESENMLNYPAWLKIEYRQMQPEFLTIRSQ